MKKNLLFIGGGLTVLIIAIVIGIGIFIGPIIKMGIETLGPKITKVDIKLDAVDVSLLTGSALIQGLIVENPEGFKTPQAIKLGVASVGLNPFSVFSDKIVIRSIRVESPEITFDGGLGGNNLSKILENVNSSAKSGDSASAKGEAGSKETSNKPAPKIQIDDFLITGARVHVFLKGVSNKELTISLPDIHMTDLGKEKDGITPAEIVHIILSKITTLTAKEVSYVIANSGKVLKDLGKDVGGSVTSVVKDLGGLFK